MNYQSEMQLEHFTPIYTEIHSVTEDGQSLLRVVKNQKLEEFDENTYAKLNKVLFHNGIIEAKLKGHLLPDAPDFARGFVGIVYRVNEDDTAFESFYLRPANGRSCQDSIRRAHGCQYFSYPGYTFSYFRDHGITEYEASADIELDEWITLKAVIQDERAEFYLNGSQKPILVVNQMKHGIGQKGAVGIYVDTGTEAFVADFKVTCFD